MDVAYDGRQVVGMDLHRRRSVLVRMTMDGRRLETARIENSPAALRGVLARCGHLVIAAALADVPRAACPLCYPSISDV